MGWEQGKKRWTRNSEEAALRAKDIEKKKRQGTETEYAWQSISKLKVVTLLLKMKGTMLARFAVASDHLFVLQLALTTYSIMLKTWKNYIVATGTYRTIMQAQFFSCSSFADIQNRDGCCNLWLCERCTTHNLSIYLCPIYCKNYLAIMRHLCFIA